MFQNQRITGGHSSSGHWREMPCHSSKTGNFPVYFLPKCLILQDPIFKNREISRFLSNRNGVGTGECITAEHLHVIGARENTRATDLLALQLHTVFGRGEPALSEQRPFNHRCQCMRRLIV
jgi:hypothetical protein